MRVYLGIVARRHRTPVAPALLRAARELITEAFPVPADVITRDEWVSPGGSVALLGWSNEPVSELLPAILTGGPQGRSLGHCGYLAEPGDAVRVLGWDGLARAGGLGGVFSLFRGTEDGIEAATSLARVCPVYYAQTPDVVVVGSRAFLVHLVAQEAAGDPGLSIDVPSLVPLVHHGFFTTDATPFTGVQALPAASVLTAKTGGSCSVSPTDPPAPEPAGRTSREAGVADLASALVAAAAPLGRAGTPVRLALSGGRDSRLMAAALHAAGVPFHAYTHGFADSPDMILGKRIAETLGIEHEVQLTVPGQTELTTLTVGHPLARVIHVVQMCEGMTSGYESVNGYQPFALEPATSGSGGETLRGGFLYDQKDVTSTGLAKRVRSLFHAADWLLTADAIGGFRTASAPWEACDGFTALDRIYLYYRTGRWIVGSHSATLMNSLYYHPFFDNRVVRAALSLPAQWRWTEEPFYRTIAALAPAVADLPTEGKRWRFEAKRPSRITDWRAWRRREPVMPVGRTAGFNWRTSTGPALLDVLTGQILDGPKELFEIVDRTKAEEFLSGLRVGTKKGWIKQAWHMYTMSVLLAGTWRPGRAPADLPEITLPIR
jgi:hypothetical protein